jgi:hypothetical protein
MEGGKIEYEELTEKIIGCAFTVYDTQLKQ